MGYTTEGSIKNFWPDNTETQLYIPSYSPQSISELLQLARAKWPHATIDDICITSEKIHTHCITYDLYDPSDYTDFIVLTLE